MLVYMATNKTNGKEYIGQTVKSFDQRRDEHISAARRGSTNLYFHKAIRKYGPENFEWEVLDEARNIDELNELEMFFIKLFKTYGKGYNLTLGGHSTIGWVPTQETRDKISAANKGRKKPPRSQEYRDKISKIHKGRKHSSEHIENNRKAKLGSHPNVSKKERARRAERAYNLGKRKKTKEEVAKMVATQTGVNTQNEGYVVITPKGIKIEVPCMSKFCKEWTEENLIPQNMSSVAAGKRKYHKGYQCFYKENYNG